jgi:hypothetical protein
MADSNLPRWVRLSEAFWLDARLRRCPVESRYLFVELFAHATTLGQQGHVPADQVELLSYGPGWGLSTKEAAEPLLDEKLTLNTKTGLFVPRWSKWQETEEQQVATQANRKKGAERSRQNRAKTKAELAELDDLRARIAEIEKDEPGA